MVPWVSSVDYIANNDYVRLNYVNSGIEEEIMLVADPSNNLVCIVHILSNIPEVTYVLETLCILSIKLLLDSVVISFPE